MTLIALQAQIAKETTLCVNLDLLAFKECRPSVLMNLNSKIIPVNQFVSLVLQVFFAIRQRLVLPQGFVQKDNTVRKIYRHKNVTSVRIGQSRVAPQRLVVSSASLVNTVPLLALMSFLPTRVTLDTTV